MEVTFTDAQIKYEEHPDKAPHKEDLDALNTGDHIKVCVNEKEQFWIKIVGVEGDTIKGTVDNKMSHTDEHGLKFGDELEVEKKHAYEVHFENESWE